MPALKRVQCSFISPIIGPRNRINRAKEKMNNEFSLLLRYIFGSCYHMFIYSSETSLPVSLKANCASNSDCGLTFLLKKIFIPSFSKVTFVSA